LIHQRHHFVAECLHIVNSQCSCHSCPFFIDVRCPWYSSGCNSTHSFWHREISASSSSSPVRSSDQVPSTCRPPCLSSQSHRQRPHLSRSIKHHRWLHSRGRVSIC